MRPKKTILLVDGNDLRHSARRFILETRGFAVLSARSSRSAAGVLAACAPSSLYLVIVSDSVDVPGAIVILSQAFQPEARTLLVLDCAVATEEYSSGANVVTSWPATATAEVLQKIRILVARKRGPKKPLLRPTPTVTQARSAEYA